MPRNDGTPSLAEDIDSVANGYVLDAYCDGYPELEHARAELLQEMLNPAASAIEATYQLQLVKYKSVVAAFARYTVAAVEQSRPEAPRGFVLQRAAGSVALSETTQRHLAIMRYFVPRTPEITEDILPITYKAGEAASHAFTKAILLQQSASSRAPGVRKSPLETMSKAVEGFITGQISSEQEFIDGMFNKGL